MKKVFSLMLLLMAVFTFTSCGSDDDEPDYPSIVGTWSRVAVEESSGSITITYLHKEKFDANGNAQTIAEGYINNKLYQTKSFDYTYTYNGKKLTMKSVSTGETEKYTVTISGNKLTQVGDGGTFVFTKE